MRFSVTPDQLVGGAASIDPGGPGDETLPAASLGAAGAGTPVAGAWSEFFGRAAGAAVALDAVSAELANGLRVAAANYGTTEAHNAENLGGRR
ncbi:MAG: type VII secretion target [Conexibacteraceae bacterium]|nr:type VII secretion target [Conexibacteraceae bacterium]